MKTLNGTLAERLLTITPVQAAEYGDAFTTGYAVTRRFLLGLGAPIDDAEEIAQAAWVRGWEYRDQLRDARLIGFWVNSIARNLLRARFRRPLTTRIEDLSPSYTMDLEALELRRLLECCPRRDRALLERSLQGFSAEEIARVVGITSTGIRVRLLRIRQSLRDRMSQAA